MLVKRIRLYLFILISCAVGYAWLLFAFFSGNTEKENPIEVCLIKHVTDIPCPSCGSTRAALSLLHGNISESLVINPFGLIIVLLMTVAPPWIFYDLVTRKDTFQKYYISIEVFIRKPKIAITFSLLVLINWIWNISKGL
ncbi:MAG TPA: DUF2752 domain-containing protein [Bacteroidales bacterium]|nr:DUF2752 domain-containing protein [Bacteroidales bacterium]